MSFVATPLKKGSYERDGLIEAAAKQLRPFGFGRAESAVIGTHQGPYFVQGQGVAALKRYTNVQFEGENWDGTKTVLNGTVERAMAGLAGYRARSRQMA